MRGSKERKVIIGAVIVTLILVTLFVVLQVPRRVKLLFPTEKTIEQDVKKYLKKRYKQDFHVTNIIPPSYEYASYIITVYPYGKPMDEEHKATVQGWEKDGLITYYDNYALVKLIPEHEQYVKDIVDEYLKGYNQYKLYISYSEEWYTENLDSNITLEEYLKSESSWSNNTNIDIYVLMDGKIDENIKKNNTLMANQLNNMGIKGCFSIVYTNNFEEYHAMNRSWRGGDMSKYDFLDFSIYDKDNIRLFY